MRVDVHQHIWTEPLLEALRARDRLPFVRRVDGLTVLHCLGERPYVIDVEAEAPARRIELLDHDGLDLALIALSSPIGIEMLRRDAAVELIDAHLQGVGALGDRFAAWGPIALDRPSADDVDVLLDRGCVGISLPAGALIGADAIIALGPVLERIAQRQVPLFVHPGSTPAEEQALGDPLWWPALTAYVAQMQAAWLTFLTAGRREHPDLVVVFAMLAGGAPLHSGRLASRGGPAIDLRDRRLFYDTSSYDSRALEAIAEMVGHDQLVYGSDRPVIEPFVGGDFARQESSARILSPIGAAA
jgi:6-methylsalicylate decarboxylase